MSRRKPKAPEVKYWRAGGPNQNGYPYGLDDLPRHANNGNPCAWSAWKLAYVRAVTAREPWEVGWRVAAHDPAYVEWPRPRPEPTPPPGEVPGQLALL